MQARLERQYGRRGRADAIIWTVTDYSVENGCCSCCGVVVGLKGEEKRKGWERCEGRIQVCCPRVYTHARTHLLHLHDLILGPYQREARQARPVMSLSVRTNKAIATIDHRSSTITMTKSHTTHARSRTHTHTL